MRKVSEVRVEKGHFLEDFLAMPCFHDVVGGRFGSWGWYIQCIGMLFYYYFYIIHINTCVYLYILYRIYIYIYI